jgi:hypothetical protein
MLLIYELTLKIELTLQTKQIIIILFIRGL